MIVIAEKYGQLGNRLFVFAHVLACALEHGVKVSNPAFDEYAEFFENTRRDLFCRHPARASLLTGRRLRGWLYAAAHRLAHSLAYRSPSNRFWHVVQVAEGDRYDLRSPEFVAAAREKSLVFVQGWLLRDEVSLRKHADAVRGFFKPVGALERRVAAHVARAREGCDVLVGVHIRQGDYRGFEGGRYFYGSGEYARMMGEAESLFAGRRVGFLICSNVRQDEAVFAGLHYTSGPGHFVEDMYALAGCDYIVGPPSTYTLWASFYGGAPLYHVREGSAAVALEDFRPYGA
jgi:hypothetical protein